MLDHRRRISKANRGDDDPVLGCGIHVDVVDTHAMTGDDAELGRLLDHPALDAGDADDDRLGTCKMLLPVLRFGAFWNDDL